MSSPKTKRPPDLHHAVSVLQNISRDTHLKSPKAIGEIYLASLALLYHLRLDQATIHMIRKQNEDADNIPFPKANAIPAMMTVIHNQKLFRALVSCLSCSADDTTNLTKNKPLFPALQSRKRTHSVGGETPSDNPMSAPPHKFAKTTLSPHASKRAIRTPIANAQNSNSTRPEFNVRVLAATILFISFEHLDHWPVPLIQAYADDCFGPRLWVDLPTCGLLAENLALAHQEGGKVSDSPSQNCSQEATLVAEFYKDLIVDSHSEDLSEKVSSILSSPSKLVRRGSHSSVASNFSSVSQSSTGLPRRNRALSHDSVEKSIISPAPSINGDKESNNHSDSDSGDDEEIAVATNLTKSTDATENDDGASSSSGEEDEEEEVVLAATKSFDEDRNSSGKTMDPNALKLTYPVVQERLRFERIRQRYFGTNLDSAHHAIAHSLNGRLDLKSKQNSGLLQCLPSFTSIAPVRSLVAGSLEKWLQSPALAGLARNLFSTTVKSMQNAEPPLADDLEAIGCILSMRLKSNQLNAHVENVTAIAKLIPTRTVADHIYSNLLRQILRSVDTSESYSNQLKMIQAVYTSLPQKLSSDAMASSLHRIIVEQNDSNTTNSTPLINKVRDVVRAIATELGSAFDGCNLLSSLVAEQVPTESITMQDLGNKARILFQCATLLPKNYESARKSTSANGMDVDDDEADKSLAQTISDARHLLLKWCCREFAPHIKETKVKLEKEEIAGAGPADFTSILDGINTIKFSKWLDVARCILFLEDSSSERMKLMLALSPSDWEDEAKRIDICSKYGAIVDDEMVWTILKSASLKKGGMPKSMALSLLEHLFNSCRNGGNGTLDVRDPNIIWELYQLVEYIPPKTGQAQASNTKKNGKGNSSHEIDLDDPKVERDEERGIEDAEEKSTKSEIPKLAYPGMWWRATGLALILCGKSPNEIGSVAWKDHPTLRALMKMVTSDRFRFPTVDCDSIAREDMLKSEQSMRSREGKVTEALFSPPKKMLKKKKKDITSEGPRGSRMSRRQKDKREKQLKKQREKEAVQEKAEQIRRKKMLRAAQKSIMLWDPRNGARKPPKESVELIFSVNEMFDLAGAFQMNVEPDFLLKTIGNTTRGAIERAYDWLIPIISQIPDAIQRLPASASCFLLLRAYGTEGEERDQLQMLSAPLLLHVRNSLTGKFGEADAKRAFDLLLTDASFHNAERRRNARRVLNDALGEEKEISVETTSAFHDTKYSWMIKMISVEHATCFMGDAINFLYRAASFERGRTLRFHVLALEQLTAFANNAEIPGDWDFAAILVKLISSRPTVLAASMSSFPDLRSTAIRIVHDEFNANVKSPSIIDTENDDSNVEIKLHCGPDTADDTSKGVVDAVLPRALLQSSCVLLSIWLDDQKDTEENRAVRDLVKMLMEPREGVSESSSLDDKDGLASARAANTGKSAVPVESWVMLAKSRSDFIAKRAALTAPISFLTRLLLCSGLPRASLLTMIDRLGKVGEKAESQDKAFNQLFASSATSEWDIGRLGPRREVQRKLLGRLSAYSRMYGLNKLRSEDNTTLTFLNWLCDSCKSNEKQRKSKSKKAKTTASKTLGNLDRLSSVFGKISSFDLAGTETQIVQIKGDASDMAKFRVFGSEEMPVDNNTIGDNNVLSSIAKAFERNDLNNLNSLLELHFEHHTPPTKNRKRKRSSSDISSVKADEACYLLLQSFCATERKTESLACSILKWVPKLSVPSGSPKLWQLLFQPDQKPYSMWKNLISRCCECWSGRHVAECRDWILAQEKPHDLDLENSIRFFLLSSSLHSVDISRSGGSLPKGGDTSWGRTADTVLSVTKLALDCIVKSEDELMDSRLRSRNELPEPLIVLLLMARLGKKQVNVISQTVVERMKGADENALFRFRAIILRIYAYFPQSMNLGVAVLRSVLKSSVDSLAIDWLSWRSPMDDEYQDMLGSVVGSAAPIRLIQALAEAAKKHPLLLLRKAPYLQQVLSADAVAIDITEGSGKPGVVVGQNASGPLEAKMEGRLVKVSVKHWGFNYTESIWTALLDIVSNAPAEVLYGCGLKMGMKNFLEIYLRLMFIQTQLRTSERFTRLKRKYGDMLKAFEKSNPEEWEQWLSAEIADLHTLGAVRNVLMSCGFITHQQAIDYVKKSAQNEGSKE
ncbi:unnamed protein product [Cylindrotheca closterium]|uniref:Integrator complex subunit 1 RPB2-binding domain-containing protein n=1 Tax=Cylindrotheca closterium TaxID=2856 RepID=A0AAD2GAJ5_9STRA|nr:unnamed protein product [Cylindrotheca closterium]